MADITGSDGVDAVNGTDNDDTIRPGGGVHDVSAMAGNDLILLPAGDGKLSWGSIYDGGDGYDTLDASAATGNVRIVGQGVPTFGIPVTTVANVEHFVGSDAGDIFVMLTDTAGVSIEAGAGNDILLGGSGNDRLDGGAGTDVTLYLDLYRSATISVSGADATVTSPSGGTDQLHSVEYTIFKDGVFTTDEDGQAAQVARLYDAVLNRAPTNAELDDHVHALQHGASLGSLATALATPSDALGIADGSDGAFLDGLYTGLLGRAADGDGKTHWLDALAHGASRGDVVAAFAQSGEHRAMAPDVAANGLFVTDEASQDVALLFHAMDGRRPDGDGLDFWSMQLKLGYQTIDQVAQGFVSSAEWHGHTDGLSNPDLVQYMYTTALGRQADGSGLQYWTDQLDHGLTQAQMLQAFALSPEHQQLLAADIHGGILLAG